MVLLQLINHLINRYIPSNWLSVKREFASTVPINRKILPSFTAARAGSSNRKQNFFRRLRHWWNFSTWLVELFFCRKSSKTLGFSLFSHISKLLWTRWVAYWFFSANFTLISEKWLWPLEYPFKNNLGMKSPKTLRIAQPQLEVTGSYKKKKKRKKRVPGVPRGSLRRKYGGCFGGYGRLHRGFGSSRARN